MSKKMNYSFQVRKEIESLNSNMTDEELFSSKAFANYIEKALSVELLGNPELCKRQIVTDFFADPNDPFTAATNNAYVISNMLSPLIQMAETREDKYYSNLGQIIHEGGHLWFTDFPAYSKWIDHFHSSKKFKWWPCKPENVHADEFRDYLNKYPNFREYIAHLCKGLQNIEEDAHIEYCLSTVFGGSFMHGIKVIRDNIHKNTPELEAVVGNVHAGRILFPDLVLCTLQSVEFGYELKMRDQNFKTKDAVAISLMKYLNETKEIRAALITENNGMERSRYLNELLCCFWDFLPKPGEDQKETDNKGSEKNKQSSGSEEKQEGQSDDSGKGVNSESDPEDNDSCNSDNSSCSSVEKEELNAEEGQSENHSEPHGSESLDFTDEQVIDMIAALETALEEMGGMSQEPVGRTKPIDLGQSATEAKKNSERNKINGMEAHQEDVKKAMKQIIENAAVQNVESHREAVLEKEAQQIFIRKKGVSDNLKWKYEIRRECGNSYTDQMYQDSYERVKVHSNPAKRQLERVLKLRKQEGKTRGYTTGCFDASSIYRTAYQNDGHNFTRRYEPDGDPDVVFGLLIDESGSMSGTKLISAMDTSILLDDILSKFRIPYMIAGHHVVHNNDCTIEVLEDFDEIEKNARYRLGLLTADGSNRDGAAIAYCAERLLDRAEKQKVLIVISDGWPTNTGFHQNVDSIDDTRLTVDEYLKKGVTIFGAVIDGDVDSIRQIYGDKTMDLTDLAALPKVLSALVRRYVTK